MARVRSAAAKAAPKKKSEDEQAALAIADNDELGEVLGDIDLGTDGLEEVDSSDIRLAALIWNFKGVDANDDPIAPNRLFNTLTEEVSEKRRLTLLTLHKSNAWTEFDEGEQRTKTRCRSWDRVEGVMEDGTVRKCEGCPDKQWKRNPETGKRGRNCSDVHNVVGLDLEDELQPVVVRFKRTSERPWIDYLNKHVIGKRVVGGKRTHMPLFAHATTLSLKMQKGRGGAYAIPVLEREDELFSKDELLFFAESAKAFRESYLKDFREVAESTPDHDEAAPADDSFNPDSFADDDFDDAAAGGESEGAAKRF